MPNSELLLRAAKNFFSKSGQLCPEAMVYELDHLRENLPMLASDHQTVQDLEFTRKFLDSVVDFIIECNEVKKA